MLLFWYQNGRFWGVPPKGEKGVTALLALAREGNLPNWWLGWIAGQLDSWIGGLAGHWVGKWWILGWDASTSDAKVIYLIGGLAG